MKIEIIKEDKIGFSAGSPYTFKCKNIIDRYYRLFTIITRPANNCQLSVIGNADNLTFLNLKFKQDKKLLFTTIKKYTSRQILLDINVKYLDTIKEIFKEVADIVLCSEYTSTNTSKMVIIIFKWKY